VSDFNQIVRAKMALVVVVVVVVVMF